MLASKLCIFALDCWSHVHALMASLHCCYCFSSIHDHVDDVWVVHFGITIGVSKASEVHVKGNITSSEQFFLRFGFMGKWSSCERDITSSEQFSLRFILPSQMADTSWACSFLLITWKQTGGRLIFSQKRPLGHIFWKLRKESAQQRLKGWNEAVMFIVSVCFCSYYQSCVQKV